MIKTLTAIALAAGIGFAPTPAVAAPTADEIGFNISQIAKCEVFAGQAGLTDYEAAYNEAAKRLQLASGFPQWNQGYWYGTGVGWAMSIVEATDKSRATLVRLFVQDCLGEGQSS